MIVSVTINGYLVPNDENVNYTVSYEDNDHAGTGKVILTATDDGSLYGTVTKSFTVSSALSFSDAEISLEEDEFVYNGLAIDDRIVMTVTLGGNVLTFGTDYSWSTVGDSTNVGTVTILVSGLGKYAGEETSVTCDIIAVQMSDLTVEFSSYLSDDGDYAFIIYPEYDIENNINPYIVISYNGEEFDLSDFDIVWYDENGDEVDMFFNNGYYYATISSNNPNFDGDLLTAILTVELWEI